VARDALLQFAADPGLDIVAPNVYDIAIHHAALIEMVTAYLTAEGPWKLCYRGTDGDVQQMRGAEAQGRTVLQGPSCGGNEAFPAVASANRSAAQARQREVLRARLSQEGEITSEPVRLVSEREGGDAPSRLRPPTSGDMALPRLPSGTASGIRDLDFQPDSFLMDDGRLRRVVLCSTWSILRRDEERTSWRTLADVCVTGRPMLLNFIVIGQARNGFRPTPWTQGFIHPENHILRVKRIATEKTGPNPKFTENWKKVYREQTDHHPPAWLKIMQDDEAFSGLVQHCTVDVPANQEEVLADLRRIEGEMGSTVMRRSGCFRFSPCPMAILCHRPGNMTPESSGWKRKPVVR